MFDPVHNPPPLFPPPYDRSNPPLSTCGKEVHLLWLFLSTPSLAALPLLGFEGEVAGSQLILHGTIGGQKSCLSDDARDVTTFLELIPRSVLLGNPVPLPGDSSQWIQLLGGTFPDGSIAAVYGQPLLSPGEEVILLLNYREDGSPELLSTPNPRHTLYRVVTLDSSDGSHGESAVVDGEGFLLLRGEEGIKRGPRLPHGYSSLPFGDPIDYPQLREEILTVAAEVETPEANAPWSGSWSGAARLAVQEADRELVCATTLHGEALPTGELYLDGRCNLPYIGVASVGLEAVYTVGGWSGTLSVFPEDERWEGRSYPLAGGGGQEGFQASIQTEEVHGGASLSGSGELLTHFGGLLPLATREDVLTWIDETITRTGVTGGLARSVKPTPQSCSISIQPLPMIGE